MAKGELSKSEQMRKQREENAPESIVGRFRVSKPALVSDTLGETEESRLQSLLAVVKSGLRTYIDVGEALLEIRDHRLYRGTHTTFEDFCRDHFGFSRQQGYRLIDASRVAGALAPIGVQPANEAQARELVPLVDEPEQMREVLVEASKDGETTAAKLRRGVDRRIDRSAKEQSNELCFRGAQLNALRSAAMAGNREVVFSLVEGKLIAVEPDA